MFVNPWLKSLRTKFLPKSQTKRGPRVWRPRLQLEWLEERLTPATYNWDGVANLTISMGTNQFLTIQETGGTITFRTFGGGANFSAIPGSVQAVGNGTASISFGVGQFANSLWINNVGAGAGANNVTFNG